MVTLLTVNVDLKGWFMVLIEHAIAERPSGRRRNQGEFAAESDIALDSD